MHKFGEKLNFIDIPIYNTLEGLIKILFHFNDKFSQVLEYVDISS